MKNSRNTDPESSAIAGELIEKSGLASKHRLVVLNAVRRFPGLTSAELAERTPLDRYQVARRLPEISGVVRGAARKCYVTDIKSVTWWAAK